MLSIFERPFPYRRPFLIEEYRKRIQSLGYDLRILSLLTKELRELENYDETLQTGTL